VPANKMISVNYTMHVIAIMLSCIAIVLHSKNQTVVLANNLVTVVA